MDIWFDVDAALAEVPANIIPLVSSTDFVSIKEAVTGTTDSGIDLNWNFVNTAGAMSQTTVQPTTDGNYLWTHIGNGMYTIYVPASGGASINNDAEGFGWFTGVATGVLPWRSPVFGFRASGLNDKLIDSAYSATRGLAGTALPDAAADAAGGLPISDAGALDLDAQIKTDIDAILVDTGTDGVKIASAQTVATVTNLTNLPTMPTDWVTAAGLKADAVTKIQNGLATAAALDAVDNFVDTEVAAILAAVDTEVAAIKAKTDNLPATPASAGEYTAAIAAIPTTPLLAANYVAPDNASIAAILEDTGTTIPATLAGLATSTEVGAIALLGETVIGSYTVQDILKILAAKMVGKATGGGTATITYRGVDDASDVIIETVDSNGNRSAVTLTV